MNITKREILLSIAIIAILLVLGLSISDRIAYSENENFAEYQKALHINNKDLFVHCMETNFGNAFVYGDLIAVDPVSYDEIDGQYSYIKKVKEEYTRHTRTVTKTKTVNGKTQKYTTTEVYWSWDVVKTEDKKCSMINFCGVDFDSNKFVLPISNYITTINKSSNIRYKYYGTDIKHTGTIYTELKDNTILDNNRFYNNTTTDEALQLLTQSNIVVFWIFWIILTISFVIGFYYLENKWLEGD